MLLELIRNLMILGEYELKTVLNSNPRFNIMSVTSCFTRRFALSLGRKGCQLGEWDSKTIRLNLKSKIA
ncbi:MAG: hypothetical protein AAF915_16465 [Cyanobacteria bacterium P01_D01_bin.50]